MNRRQAITGIGAAAVGAILGYLSRGPVDFLKDRVMQRGIIFRSGQTIDNYVTPIEIDGWNLFFDVQKISDYIEDHPDRQVIFKLLYSDNRNGEVIDAWGEGRQFGGIDTYFPSKNSRRLQKVKVFPDRGIEAHAYLLFIEKKVETERSGNGHTITLDKEGRNILASELYPIRVDYNTNDNFSPVVFCEPELDTKILEEIAKLKQTLLDVRSSSGLQHISHSNIYLINTDDNGVEFRTNRKVGDMLSNNGTVINDNVVMDSAHFTNPSYKNQGILVVHHELAHILIDQIARNMRDPRANLNLFQGYSRLVELAGLTIPVEPYGIFSERPEGVEEKPLFKIFREASYLPKTQAGHPWSNHGELFASALSVFRFYPEEFVKRYSSLSNSQRKDVASVVQAILKGLELTYRYPGQILEVLPSYFTIKRAIRYS